MHIGGLFGFFRRRFHLHLYGRLMIYYTLIFLLVIYVFGFFATTYYDKYQVLTELQQSRNALNALCNYYETKQNEFTNVIYPIYQDKNNYNNLIGLLESNPDQYFSDVLSRQTIVEILQKVAEQDGDIEAILLHQESGNIKYVYLRTSAILETVSEYPYFKDMAGRKSGPLIIGTNTINLNTGAGNFLCYGIGGIIGLEMTPEVTGQFLVLYNTAAFENVFEEYSKTHGRFILASLAGNVIFDSEGKYNGKTLPYKDTILAGKTSDTIDGQLSYLQTVTGVKSNYIGVNIVPEKDLSQQNSKIALVVFGVITLLALICTSLYMLGGYIISRRVKELELAMMRVGSNNLSYRIPVSGRQDEFEEMAIKFNKMCDELQETINRVYVTEIKKKNAELGALQAGINPHFLYNTLEAIRIMAIDNGNGNVAEMIVNIANLYRSMVKNRTFIPILTEMNFCEMYTNIFALRYESCLEYEVAIEPDILEYGIPKNLLQPVIENYFVHGINNGPDVDWFKIRGFLTGEDICFVFEDNGRGIDEERLHEIKSNIEAVTPEAESGYGLLNVQKRILLVYGKPYGITLESEANHFTRITVIIKAMSCSELQTSLESPNKP